MRLFFLENYHQFFELSAVEHLLMSDFKQMTNVDTFIERIKNTGLNIIIKISEKNDTFSEFCKKEELSHFWTEKWRSFGLTLSKDSKTVAFSPHLNTCQFTLVKGAFFYQKSQFYRNYFQKDFLYSEKQFLLKAIECGSVHAVQRYNQFIYHEIDEMKAPAEIDICFQKIIKNCQGVVRNYGSYALLMQGEAYVRYCEWLISHNNMPRAKKAYDAALQCCDKAERALEASKHSIHNASFGRGLASSNSKNIADPATLKLFIISRLQAKLALIGDSSRVSSSLHLK